MNKQIVVYMYNEILFSLKKEWSADTCYNTNESWKYYTAKERSQTQKATYLLFHSYEMSIIGRFLELESRLMLARHWRKGK